MRTRDKSRRRSNVKNTNKTVVYVIFFILILLIICFITIYNISLIKNETYATDSNPEEVVISNANKIDLEEIINKNTENKEKIEFEKKEEILEYLTNYRTNIDIPKGVSYVIQEGKQGIQEITIKKTYINEEVASEEYVGNVIKKSSINKIIEIGGADYSSNYTVRVGNYVYVTTDELNLYKEKSEESQIVEELKRQDKVKVLKINNSWYKVQYNKKVGWIKQECTTYIEPSLEIIEDNELAKTKSQLLSTLNFSMNLNKKSGLTLEQFKKVLTDSKDKNNMFSNNAQYFYYVEKQYNINGIFVAAVGIHESAWGTSSIAKNKKNLFGYGAYDSNPYNGAYSFSNCFESIDLIARVFVKYYLNPKGTSIYGGEQAVGTYYNGNTLTGVNIKYATDKNWANAVYIHMKYLYNKL